MRHADLRRGTADTMGEKKKKGQIANPAVYIHIVQGSNILAVAILMYKDTHCKLTVPDKLS